MQSRHTHNTPSLDEDWPLVWLVVGHLTCPTISSVPHYWTVCTFHCPSEFVLKVEHLRLSRELHAEMWSRRFFFFFFCLTWKPNIKTVNEHHQAGANDFEHLVCTFQVCRLSPKLYNVYCSQSMSRFDQYQHHLTYLTREQHAV